MNIIVNQDNNNLKIDNLEIKEITIKENLNANIFIKTINSRDLKIDIKANSQINLLLPLEIKYPNNFITINLDRDARLNLYSFNFNETQDIKLNVNLIETSAEVNYKGVFIANSNIQQNIEAIIENKAPTTNGEILIIGISKDDSKIAINGISKIHQGMSKSSNLQSLKGFISDNSTLTLNPILLIDEFDVKAGHGASSGIIDEEIIYYLMTRGLSENKAKQLYLLGQVEPVINEIWNQDLKDLLTEKVKEAV